MPPRIWLTGVFPPFRHSIRDRLRAVQFPADIADEIGGWSTEGVGQGYGNGFGLAITHSWLSRAITSN